MGVKSKNINLNLSNTTIDPIKLGQILTKLKSQKVENIIMEASSHGLEQNRLDGLKFNSGIFTNIYGSKIGRNIFKNFFVTMFLKVVDIIIFTSKSEHKIISCT